MSNKYQNREDAPFGEQIWGLLDNVVVNAAKAQLSARKILDIEGPYGLGLKMVPLNDELVSSGDIRVSAGRSLAISLVETTFTLGARDLAAFEETGFPIDCEAVAKTAMSMAAMEESIIYEGVKELGIDGLLTASGSQKQKLISWAEIGAAAEDIIKAVTGLDNKGFHGPYILALSPDLYNLLYRLYPQGNKTELAHIEEIVGDKLVKAPSIKSGGVLIASGKQFASIIIGQDMMTGFVGPNGSNYEFKISESIAPRIRVPEAVCVLKV